MRIGLRGAITGVSLALAAGTAGAAVIVVDTALDSLVLGSCATGPPSLPTAEGNCSLRAAIETANATSGSDLILFAPAVFTTTNRVITLRAPLPDLTETVEVNATSSPLLPERLHGIVLRAGTGVSELFAVIAGQPKLDDLTLEGDGIRIDAGRLVLLHTVDSSFAGAITGAGSLQKEGAARLVLTGTNDYGDTFVEEGTLQGDTGSIPGGIAADPRSVVDDGVLVFDQEASDAPDFFGVISGSGSLRKIGAGTLVLGTPNGYGGGTTVGAGTLQGFAGSGATAGSLQGNILNDATLVFDQTADGTFAGSITGSGRVEKIGSANGAPTELLLTGSNRHSGGTLIREGILRGDADAIPGSVEIGSGAQLVFDEAGSGTNGGALTGGGGLASGLFSVEKRGAGTLTLAGPNSYSGGTLVSAGTLRGTTGSLQGDILLGTGTALVFDQAFAGTYTGQLGGPGALEKSGAGTLVLTRDLSLPGGLGSPFSGSTTVSGGRLEVGDTASARLPGPVDILAGGVLGGIGTVGGLVTARSGGAISSGNSGSIGTLAVGSASFESGSFFEVEIGPPVGTPPLSPVDLLGVAGTAAIAPGAQVRLIPGAGDYPDPGTGTPVPILTAGAIAAGEEFDPIPPGTFAFLDATLTYTDTEVLLTVESNGNQLDDFARTQNQRAVATALEMAQAGGDPDVGTVFGELNRLLAADIPDALDAMAGEQLTQFTTARLAVGQHFHESLQERIRGVGRGESEVLLSGAGAAPLLAGPLLGELAGAGLASAAGIALAGTAVAMQQPAVVDLPEPDSRGLGGWIDGYGLFGNVSGGSGTHDFDSMIWGVSAGLDARVAERWVVGAAGGWAHSELDFDGLPGSPEVQTAQGAAYAGYVSPLVEAGAAFRFGWNQMSLDRDIAFAAPSTLSRTADSEFDGIDLGGHAEAAVNLFEVRGIVIQPLASLTYAHLQQDAFDESGAGSLDLSAEEEEIDSLVSGVGARLHTLVELGDGFWLRPELRGRWLHEFGDRERKLDVRIGGLPGASYSVRGTELPRDTGSVGLGWTVSTQGRLHVFADYDVAVNSDLLQHSAAIGFRVVW